jgi:hypothetical protein
MCAAEVVEFAGWLQGGVLVHAVRLTCVWCCACHDNAHGLCVWQDSIQLDVDVVVCAAQLCYRQDCLWVCVQLGFGCSIFKPLLLAMVLLHVAAAWVAGKKVNLTAGPHAHGWQFSSDPKLYWANSTIMAARGFCECIEGLTGGAM